MIDPHDLDRALLAGVLAGAEQLRPRVVVEVALAYDLLCDPMDPPAPSVPVHLTDSGASMRQVVDSLMAAISTADVQQALTLGHAVRHLRSALDGLEQPIGGR